MVRIQSLIVGAALLALGACSNVGPTESVCAPSSLAGLRVGPATRDEGPCRDAVGRWFDSADADHDGKLTAAEAETDAMALFDRIDIDHDGALTSMETEAGRRATGGTGGMPRRGAGPRALASGLMTADTDLNFRVTRQELQDLVRRNFAGLDHDRQGALTRDEAIRGLARVTKWKAEDFANQMY